MGWLGLGDGPVEAVSLAALPLLHSIAESEGYVVLACALAGWACGVYASRAERAGAQRRKEGVAGTLERVVDTVSGLTQICFGAALLFRQAALWDPAVGAGLCAIPYFHVICVPLMLPSSARYEREMTVCLSALGALALGLSSVWALSDDAGQTTFNNNPQTDLDYFLLVTSGIFGAREVASQVSTGIVLLVLCAWTAPLQWLLLRRQRIPLLVLTGVLWVLASRRQALRVRQHLGAMIRPGGGGERWFSRPQRALMLMVATVMTLGYSFQWGDWRRASWACVAVLGGRLAVYFLGV